MKTKGSLLGFWILLSLSLFSCSKDKRKDAFFFEAPDRIPEGFPAITYPQGNEFTADRWRLGKNLFFDKRLSLNNTVSCASCHKTEYAFADNRMVSPGDKDAPGKINAPSLTNVAWFPYYTLAGGVATLEMQVLVPIQEHNEFNTNMLDIIDELKLDPVYGKMAHLAYNRTLDPYVVTRAIATFERTLVSGNSPFDRYYYQGQRQAMSLSAKRGFELFNSEKTNCSSCHAGFNFTNYAFENNGLYTSYQNTGRMRITEQKEDEAKFKVPGLRNVELTAPYMHDGSIKTLEDVIDHYNTGGKVHPNKSSLIRPLHLTDREKKDLVTFLKELTDYSFINNMNYRADD